MKPSSKIIESRNVMRLSIRAFSVGRVNVWDTLEIGNHKRGVWRCSTNDRMEDLRWDKDSKLALALRLCPESCHRQNFLSVNAMTCCIDRCRPSLVDARIPQTCYSPITVNRNVICLMAALIFNDMRPSVVLSYVWEDRGYGKESYHLSPGGW